MRGKRGSRPHAAAHRRITPAYAGKTAAECGDSTTREDHPRVCGENNLSEASLPCADGSPPRMRGKPQEAVNAKWNGRITPAYAGKTQWQALRPRNRPDHPRVCGENGRSSARYRQVGGSPPRMRGKPADEAAKGLPNRITPAYAGKTVQPCERLARIKDHPRGCGENRASSSSFRTLGRITPADAGKTQSLRNLVWRTTDHPRGCGENRLYGERGLKT